MSSSSEDRCFGGRVTELASTRPLYIGDGDWVGGVGGGNALGGGKPTPFHGLSTITRPSDADFDDISSHKTKRAFPSSTSQRGHHPSHSSVRARLND
ncbi:hypothetical protein QLX08_011317 [Tetragonisca angustula]|uniref:Uncharacterized protein n=1 Tax=Tetragonisca angustula TaxID=166442 RepID=A0AAW0Z8A2_9HYME